MKNNGRHLLFEMLECEAFVPPIGHFQHESVQNILQEPESTEAGHIEDRFPGAVEGLSYIQHYPKQLPIAVADFVKSAAAFRLTHIAENIPRSTFGPQLHMHRRQAGLYVARLTAIHNQIRVS